MSDVNQASAPASAPAAPAAEKQGWFWQGLSYLAGYFDLFKSRTNTTIVAGVIAYFLAKFHIAIDANVAADAIASAATEVGTMPMTPQDLIIFIISILAVYFRSNPKAAFTGGTG
ncbi:MAG: hypothetical protein AB7O04_15840 [Hyphomonadaceae bacterium]